MALTFDLNPPEGGILISGSADELEDFAGVLTEAAETGGAEGLLLSEQGVETVQVVAL